MSLDEQREGQPKVFVSHSSKDREFVEREIVSLLENHGIDTWYSTEDINTADEWHDRITSGLEACEWFLLVLSPNSIASEWVKDETHWAIDARKGRIVPVVIDECDSKKLHIRLGRIQHLNFREVSGKSKSRLLAVWQKRYQGPEESATPASPSRARLPEPEEKLLWAASYSGMALLGYWCVVATLVVAGFVVALLSTSNAYVWILAFAGLGALLLGVRQYYLQKAVRFELTNRQLKLRAGLLTRITDRIDLDTIYETSVSQSLMQRFWRGGTIRLFATDRSAPEIILDGIADSQRVHAMIGEAVSARRRWKNGD